MSDLGSGRPEGGFGCTDVNPHEARGREDPNAMDHHDTTPEGEAKDAPPGAAEAEEGVQEARDAKAAPPAHSKALENPEDKEGQEREGVVDVIQAIREMQEEFLVQGIQDKDEAGVMALTAWKEKGGRANKTLDWGPVAGTALGDVFLSRAELEGVGLHGMDADRIDTVLLPGVAEEPVRLACSAMAPLEDEASLPKFMAEDEFIFTGDGNSTTPGQHILEGSNLALSQNLVYNKPVRVILQQKHPQSLMEDGTAFVYAGLYSVEAYWKTTTENGAEVLKYRLAKDPAYHVMNAEVESEQEEEDEKPVVTKPKRDPKVGKAVRKPAPSKQERKATDRGEQKRMREGASKVEAMLSGYESDVDEMADEEEEYEVERIIAERIRNGKKEFLIKLEMKQSQRLFQRMINLQP
eukprot:jgi/Pico_ML_1/54756/g623.t1